MDSIDLSTSDDVVESSEDIQLLKALLFFYTFIPACWPRPPKAAYIPAPLPPPLVIAGPCWTM